MGVFIYFVCASICASVLLQFSATGHDLKLSAKQPANSEPSKEVVKELLSGDLDIYSVALSNTFDEELSQRRSERFVLNRIPKSVQKEKAMGEKTVGEKVIGEKAIGEKPVIEKTVGVKTESQIKTNVVEKYKDSALEVYDKKEQLVALSIEHSLEFGKEQKLKDFEAEKLKLENRLTWRAIREFDSDESSVEEEDGEEDDADL